MYNTACRITRNEDDAADAVQEAFISAFRNLNTLREEAGFGAWMKRIVINKSLNVLKKRNWEALSDEGDYPADDGHDLYEEHILTVERVRQAIMELPDGYRSVLSLYLLEGYDHNEIGEILGISTSTSKSQLNRSKKKLRELLSNKP